MQSKITINERARRLALAALLLWGAGCQVRVERKIEPPAPAPAATIPTPEPLPAGPVDRIPSHAFPMVQAEGTRFVADGKPIVLRGCNVGNWFLLEMWMFDLQNLKDQHEFEAVLAQRFGEAAKDRLLETYRANYITDRDFEIIRSFGFNCIRLPFEYRLLESDLEPGTFRPNPFRWLDRAVGMAERAGLYVILDLHGAPGRQSVDHCTGRVEQNRLWTDTSCQDRTVWLWKALSAHYRTNTVIAGYDLINEPFGDYNTADHLPAVRGLIDRLYREIRAGGDEHVIFIPGTRQGLNLYGSPSSNGWRQVAFTEHFYPGLFGADPSFATHARFLGLTIPAKAYRMQDLNVPFFVGEFNVPQREINGPAMMRRYYDTYASNGWAATMWSYKILHRNGGGGTGGGWEMAGNRDPLPDYNPETASYEGLDAFFKSLSTMPLGIKEELRTQLLTDTPDTLPLTHFELLRDPPHRDDVPGWLSDDLNGARAGGQRLRGSDAVEIYGGGDDIWRASDQFRFLHRDAAGDLALSARVDRLEDSDINAKAGLMLRADISSGSAHAFVHVFPDGRVYSAWRPGSGAVMQEKPLARLTFPIFLKLERKGGRIKASCSSDGLKWTASDLPVALPESLQAGLAVLAHADNQFLTTADFSGIQFRP